MKLTLLLLTIGLAVAFIALMATPAQARQIDPELLRVLQDESRHLKDRLAELAAGAKFGAAKLAELAMEMERTVELAERNLALLN